MSDKRTARVRYQVTPAFWRDVPFSELRRDDVFRLIEVDGTLIDGLWLATSDPYKQGNDDHLTIEVVATVESQQLTEK